MLTSFINLRDAYELYKSEHMAWRLKDIHQHPISFKRLVLRLKTESWCIIEDSTNGELVINDEDIDAEFAEFIELEDEKLALSKWMSKKGYKAS
ncbi:Hypothetical predicted protein [Olea europaea subsp. europaea]|uniref:Uncharacterized protein n=1 Tax=Olea europaea subsp. europaea TaxID=158383 RepID=A0A8S0VFH6_OLEEU|nr:Hypothetical predicted protein [Olea europaea subsp. europaea]